MQQSRALIEQADQPPETKAALLATFDNIMDTVSAKCPEDRHGDLATTVAMALISLAGAGQRDQMRLRTYAMSQASMFLRSLTS